MGEHTGRIEIARSAEEVFAFVADIRNLPAFLSGMRIAVPSGPGRVVVEGAQQGRRFRTEGWLRVDREALTMEWGSDGDGGRGYSGSLRVVPLGLGSDRGGEADTSPRAALELRLRMEADASSRAAELPAGRGMRAQARGQVARTLPEAIAAALGAIKSLCEGTGAAPLPRGRAMRQGGSDDGRPAGGDSRPYGSSATMNPEI